MKLEYNPRNKDNLVVFMKDVPIKETPSHYPKIATTRSILWTKPQVVKSLVSPSHNINNETPSKCGR